MIWYSQLFKNFPEFVVVHTVKGFGIGNKAEVDVLHKKDVLFIIGDWNAKVGSQEIPGTTNLTLEYKMKQVTG